MGVHGNEPRKGRGGKATKPTQLSLAGFGMPSKVGDEIKWDEGTPDLMARVVCAVTSLGGGVLFGRSRDGGALSVTLMLGDDRKTVWLNDEATVDDEMVAIAEYFEGQAT